MLLRRQQRRGTSVLDRSRKYNTFRYKFIQTACRYSELQSLKSAFQPVLLLLHVGLHRTAK
jgi:hypothetical protein